MNETMQCKKLTCSVEALGGILHRFLKMHQYVMLGVTQTRISDPLWRGVQDLWLMQKWMQN